MTNDLSDTFVKRCTCCGLPFNAAEWAALPFVGVSFDDSDAPLEALETRNCTGTYNGAPCESTIVRVVVFHPDDASYVETLTDQNPDRGDVLRVLSALQRELTLAKRKLKIAEHALSLIAVASRTAENALLAAK